MARIESFEIFSANLPFLKPFKHAAASRATSDSLFVKCVTDQGFGFGECLPRAYVTGESRDGTHDLLKDTILPQLIGREFKDYDEVKAFLNECDGQAPADWLEPTVPQSAAWSAVDLALLDAFGRIFKQSAPGLEKETPPSQLRYSGVASADTGFKFFKTALKLRLVGLTQIKLKVDDEVGVGAIKTLKAMLGAKADIRVDANMAWNRDEAFSAMRLMAAHGVTSFEQPIPADKIDDLAGLVSETGLGVMVDESLNTARSLKDLIARKACTAVNVRVSKCGGLIAARNRCREATQAGLTIQVGCQVGESSLLSAAHLALLAQVPEAKYAEGCFGHLLLKEDPVNPLLQFGYGGKAPARPQGPGLGVTVNEADLEQWTSRHNVVSSRNGKGES